MPVSVFIDLTKAFDTIDHSILLKKLKYYGIINRSLDWFDSFLTDREQFVQLEDTKSSNLPLKTGFPQGSA